MTALANTPLSIKAEQTVLGGLMLEDDSVVWTSVASIVKVTDFYRRNHQLIFAAISELASRGEAIDAVSVAESLEQHDQLHDCGGLPYLAKLCMETASTSFIHVYARQVADCARSRRIRDAAARVAAGDYEALAALLREAA